MPVYVDFGWTDLPDSLTPQAGETVADWYARVDAYVTAHPGELTPVTAAALEAFGAHVLAQAGTGGSAVDATTTVKGIVRLATAPASPSAPIAVGDNDPRMTNPRTPTAHSHPTSDVTGLDSALAAETAARVAADLALESEKADATLMASNLAAKADLVSGRVPSGQLATGTPNGSKFLRDDGTWQAVTGGVGAGTATGTTIGTTVVNGSGEPEITFESSWGIDAVTGEPYFDPVGAAPGEDALLMADQSTGELFLIQPEGATP